MSTDTKKYRNKKGWVTRFGFSKGLTEIRRVKGYRIEMTADAYAYWITVKKDDREVEFCVATLEEGRDVVQRTMRLAGAGKIESLDKLWNQVYIVPRYGRLLK